MFIEVLGIEVVYNDIITTYPILFQPYIYLITTMITANDWCRIYYPSGKIAHCPHLQYLR